MHGSQISSAACNNCAVQIPLHSPIRLQNRLKAGNNLAPDARDDVRVKLCVILAAISACPKPDHSLAKSRRLTVMQRVKRVDTAACELQEMQRRRLPERLVFAELGRRRALVLEAEWNGICSQDALDSTGVN